MQLYDIDGGWDWVGQHCKSSISGPAVIAEYPVPDHPVNLTWEGPQRSGRYSVKHGQSYGNLDASKSLTEPLILGLYNRGGSSPEHCGRIQKRHTLEECFLF